MEIRNSVALVTGGAQGIGRSIVEFLCEKGGKVMFCDLNEAVGKDVESELQKKYGKNVNFMQCDVTKSEDLDNVMIAIKKIFGSFDILINNAGIGSPDPKMARKIMEVNLTGAIEGTYKAIEVMSTKNGYKGGVIINMGSSAGIGIVSYFPLYCASKHGLVAFTRCLANYKDEGVRVNCVCPSFIDTQLTRVAMEHIKEANDFIQTYGFAEMSDLMKSIERCITQENMAGNVLAILPKGVIQDVDFHDPLPPMLESFLKS